MEISMRRESNCPRYGNSILRIQVIDLTVSQEHTYVHLFSRDQMMSLHEEIGRLQGLLEVLSGRSDSSIDVLESRIRDVAYRLEDIIEHDSMEYGIPSFESDIPSSEDDIPSIEDDIPSNEDDIPSKVSFLKKFRSLFCMRSSTVAETPKTPSPVAETPSPVAETPSPVADTPSAFDMCAREVGMLLKEAMEMKEDKLQDKDTSRLRPPLTTTTSSSDQPPTAKMDINEVPIDIMDWIFRRGSKLEIVPITGMGGIGKTTLARVVYQHPNTVHHFDICSWVTVSQEFNVKEILRGLLPYEQQNVSGERLIECVHKRLIGRRYLIVLDDMWDEKAWDGLRNAFPNDNKGSRIILTTRLLHVAAYVGYSSHIHEMQFLNDEQSWDLLREKVGGYELWPTELNDLGRTISKNCRGIPLAIVAMAGLLKFNMSEGYWQRVARDTKSETAANYDHLFSMLALSYINLPPWLKPCFLYFGLFKEDYEIPTKELVRLWAAEGFLKRRGSKEMEEVAEEYLEELVARSLVLVKKKRHDGRIKTCSIHDVIRELSLRKAQQEKFFQHITLKNMYSTDTDMRRASFGGGCFRQELDHYRHVRSLRCDGDENEVVYVIQHFMLIRLLLGKVRITENSQLSILCNLRNLRHLHIYVHSKIEGRGEPLIIGESISKLQNLETLILSGIWCTSWTSSTYALLLPSGIWKMPRLRHLILVVAGSRLPCPAPSDICYSGLQTLTGVTNLYLTRSMSAKLSNLKKLKLYYTSYIIRKKTSDEFHLNNLVYLHHLEELNIAHGYGYSCVEVADLFFPHKLKKLSLKLTNMPVKKMSLIGSLPKLEVLKLKERAIQGKEWEPIEGEFVQLKHLELNELELQEWRAESEHFPQLETLIINDCRKLKEVPAVIGEIDTLQKLVLEHCTLAEGSVEKIKREQGSLCNDSLQVIIIRSWY